MAWRGISNRKVVDIVWIKELTPAMEDEAEKDPMGQQCVCKT